LRTHRQGENKDDGDCCHCGESLDTDFLQFQAPFDCRVCSCMHAVRFSLIRRAGLGARASTKGPRVCQHWKFCSTLEQPDSFHQAAPFH
jgi:hypothetical protein